MTLRTTFKIVAWNFTLVAGLTLIDEGVTGAAVFTCILSAAFHAMTGLLEESQENRTSRIRR